MPKASGVVAGVRGDDVAVPNELVLVYQQPFNTDRSPGVGFVCADADFGAKTVTKTVSETS